MFDLKVIKSVLDQLQEERGVPKEKVLEAIAMALATAYKKEYGKKGQIVRATFDVDTGKVDFSQVKVVVDPEKISMEDAASEEEPATDADAEKIRFNPEHHILLGDAKKIKKDAKIDDEMIFPLDSKSDYGRIAAQTAKQVIIQKIREAEKVSVMEEYGKRTGEIVSGTVQRIERGNLFIDMGRTSAILPYEEQIPGERYKQGERIRAYLFKVEETPKGVFLKLSRAHPKFLEKLFAMETPEVASGVVEIKVVAREAGSRSKIAVLSHDSHVDPVGSLVGQRGVRVSTVMSELGGEKIDIIEWSADAKQFIEDALSPARVLSVLIIDENEKRAKVNVAPDQQSLAIGKGGQNVRLAAKLTGWRIDIQSEGVPEALNEETAAPNSESSKP
ncbi:MAG: transcription termination factor NusA [Candidatus Taylorbacteria bacterium RIFCSPHIGHO2_02_FULL_46_13]|uniref:Transcription termination/antitermination protein NusA n=1 Tax=Candidatus Taylorbacteria bacterium RIFCSPHIGHO2_02_FULL_46_13 TaxID=1802312 RepID=A0A1G2MS81_9BACT|nr:MAG: transcription termination factor NusA [Candidatus Taylorbacteria bacterium RIFCSPHIGHO2_02_FULL_46_13]